MRSCLTFWLISFPPFPFSIQHSSFVHSPTHQPIPPSIHSHSSLILNIQQLFGGSDFVGFAFLFPFSVSPSSKSPCPSVLSVHSLKAVMRPLLPSLLRFLFRTRFAFTSPLRLSILHIPVLLQLPPSSLSFLVFQSHLLLHSIIWLWWLFARGKFTVRFQESNRSRRVRVRGRRRMPADTKHARFGGFGGNAEARRVGCLLFCETKMFAWRRRWEIISPL